MTAAAELDTSVLAVGARRVHAEVPRRRHVHLLVDLQGHAPRLVAGVVTVVYDTTPPDTTVWTPNNTAFSNTTQITGSATDTAPGVLARVEVSTNNGSTWTSVSGNTMPNWTHQFSASTDGTYNLRFRAVDKAGNVDDTPATLSVKRIAPDGISPDTQ